MNKKIFSRWTFLIPTIQFLCILFFLLIPRLGFFLLIFPEKILSGIVVILFATIIVLAILPLAFFFIPVPGYTRFTYPLITFLVGLIIPVLIFSFFSGNIVTYFINKNQTREIEQYEKQAHDKVIEKAYSDAEKAGKYSIVAKPATNITTHSVQLNAYISNSEDDIPPYPLPYFIYGLSKDNLDLISVNNKKTSLGAYLVNIDNLSPNTTYYFRAVIDFDPVLNPGDTYKKISAEILSFTTL